MYMIHGIHQYDQSKNTFKAYAYCEPLTKRVFTTIIYIITQQD
jgi:hypothetical protein